MLFKRIWVPLALGALALLISSTAAVADDGESAWEVDTDRSSIRFVSDAPMERIVGTSEQVEGRVNFDVSSPADASGEIRFRVDSMRTGNSTRDSHLTEEDWLDADESPYIRFKLTGIDNPRVARSDDRIDVRGTATGTVEVRGVEQPGEADVEIAILPERNLARIQPTLEVRLAEYEIPGRDNAIGREVGEVIEVDGTLYANQE